MKWLFALSIAVAAAHGQNALWIELSGPWRMTTDGWPGFDDRQWQTFVLPSPAVRPPGHMCELCGFERTREISTKSAQEIAKAAKAWGQNDDITVVTVRRNA